MTTRHQRPSDDLPTLGWQLRTALEALADDAEGPDARDFRRFLRHAVAHGWRGAATGKFTTLREVIDLVREVRPWIDDALPKLSPRALAAVEVQQALAVLYMGEDELREVELENRLTDHGRHPTERAVLEALAGAERPLRQSEVHARLRLSKNDKPTPSRVGQILRELYDHGFTRRQLARSRGRAEAAHYQLAPRGLALCEQQGLLRREAKVAATRDATPRATPQKQPPSPDISIALAQAWGNLQLRYIVRGLLQSAPDPGFGRSLLDTLGNTPRPGVGRGKRRASVIAKNDLDQEREDLDSTQWVMSRDVQLVTASG